MRLRLVVAGVLAVLALLCATVSHAEEAALSPKNIGIALRSTWTETELLPEAAQFFASDALKPKVWSFLRAVVGEFDGTRLDAQKQYLAAISAAAHLLGPVSLGVFNTSLQLREHSPAVEMYARLFAQQCQTPELDACAAVALSGAECACVTDDVDSWTPSSAESPTSVEALAPSLLVMDKDFVYPSERHADSPHLVFLYLDLASGDVGVPAALESFTARASSGEIRLVVRPKAPPTALRSSTPLFVPSFGAEFAIKDMEYKVLDDTKVEMPSDMGVDASALFADEDAEDEVCGFMFSRLAQLHPDRSEQLGAFKTFLQRRLATQDKEVKLWDLQRLGRQSTHRILAAKQPAQALEDLSGNFPVYGPRLIRTPVPQEVDDRVKALHGVLGSAQGESFLVINSKMIDVSQLNLYRLQSVLKTEAVWMDRIQEELKWPQLLWSPRASDFDAGELESFEDPYTTEVKRQTRRRGAVDVAGLSDSASSHDQFLAGMQVTGRAKVRLQIYSEQRQNAAPQGALVWLNDMARDSRYEQWPSELQVLARPQWPNTLRYIRANIVRGVMLLDPARKSHLHFYARARYFVEGNAPMQFGLVLVAGRDTARGPESSSQWQFEDTSPSGLAAMFSKSQASALGCGVESDAEDSGHGGGGDHGWDQIAARIDASGPTRNASELCQDAAAFYHPISRLIAQTYGYLLKRFAKPRKALKFLDLLHERAEEYERDPELSDVQFAFRHAVRTARKSVSASQAEDLLERVRASAKRTHAFLRTQEWAVRKGIVAHERPRLLANGALFTHPENKEFRETMMQAVLGEQEQVARRVVHGVLSQEVVDARADQDGVDGLLDFLELEMGACTPALWGAAGGAEQFRRQGLARPSDVIRQQHQDRLVHPLPPFELATQVPHIRTRIEERAGSALLVVWAAADLSTAHGLALARELAVALSDPQGAVLWNGVRRVGGQVAVAFLPADSADHGEQDSQGDGFAQHLYSVATAVAVHANAGFSGDHTAVWGFLARYFSLAAYLQGDLEGLQAAVTLWRAQTADQVDASLLAVAADTGEQHTLAVAATRQFADELRLPANSLVVNGHRFCGFGALSGSNPFTRQALQSEITTALHQHWSKRDGAWFSLEGLVQTAESLVDRASLAEQHYALVEASSLITSRGFQKAAEGVNDWLQGVSEVSSGLQQLLSLPVDQVLKTYPAFAVTAASQSASEGALRILAVVDPLSNDAVKLGAIINFLSSLGASPLLETRGPRRFFDLTVVLNPKWEIDSFPLQSFQRYVTPVRGGMSFDSDSGGVTVDSRPAASFKSLLTARVLSLSLHTPDAWLVESWEARHDMDNLRTSEVEGDTVYAEYSLRALLIHGSAYDTAQQSHAAGLPLQLSQLTGHGLVSDTLAMNNHGYFQLQSHPGVFRLSLAAPGPRVFWVRDLQSVERSLASNEDQRDAGLWVDRPNHEGRLSDATSAPSTHVQAAVADACTPGPVGPQGPNPEQRFFSMGGEVVGAGQLVCAPRTWESTEIFTYVGSFEGSSVVLNVDRQPDQHHAQYSDVLESFYQEQADSQHGSAVTTARSDTPAGPEDGDARAVVVADIWQVLGPELKAFWFDGEHTPTDPDKPTVHVFSIASGLLYERFLRIMMLSVVKRSSSPVTFWFIDNFLSPHFKQSVPLMAEALGFSVEFVTYQWPVWLRRQTVKQRVIWGYKILFLDVLFPLSLPRVIYVDADQVVRGDITQLWEMDLEGAPYAYTPFCDSNKDTEGFRFWKQGFWAQHLRGKPYHISALYVVDLQRFRQMSAGDQLRTVYDNLSADPNSLSNLDQDLPNYVQHRVPIFSLPEEWLWCQAWCSIDSLDRAKTIDLCNNPLTKKPKLEVARDLLPEWPAYDQMGRSVMDFVEAQEGAAVQWVSGEGEPGDKDEL